MKWPSSTAFLFVLGGIVLSRINRTVQSWREGGGRRGSVEGGGSRVSRVYSVGIGEPWRNSLHSHVGERGTCTNKRSCASSRLRLGTRDPK